MENKKQCPSCKKQSLIPFGKENEPYMITGNHCNVCGYYETEEGEKRFSVLAVCEKCSIECWVPDFSLTSPGNGMVLSLWRCRKCDHENNILTTFKKK